jgi:ParB-like nuclease domain
MGESEAATLWPADQIERRAVAVLIPHARNARRHGPAQIAEIAGLIREWGWTVPVLIDESDGIIAGHGRVLAAQQLGIADIPVVVARGWDDARKRAYMIADNEVSSHSTWNKELLRVELADLAQHGVDLQTIGFDAADIAKRSAATGDLPQALQLEPAREYVVIMCASLDEWETLKVALSLVPVRRGGYKRGSPLDDVGTQRVVHAADVLRLIER